MRSKGNKYNELYNQVEKEIWTLLGKESLRCSYPLFSYETDKIMKHESHIKPGSRKNRLAFGIEAAGKCIDLIDSLDDLNVLENEIEENNYTLQDLYRCYRNDYYLNSSGLIRLIKESNILNDNNIKIIDIWNEIKRFTCFTGEFSINIL